MNYISSVRRVVYLRILELGSKIYRVNTELTNKCIFTKYIIIRIRR